jgi:hypothetical protein
VRGISGRTRLLTKLLCADRFASRGTRRATREPRRWAVKAISRWQLDGGLWCALRSFSERPHCARFPPEDEVPGVKNVSSLTTPSCLLDRPHERAVSARERFSGEGVGCARSNPRKRAANARVCLIDRPPMTRCGKSAARWRTGRTRVGGGDVRQWGTFHSFAMTCRSCAFAGV